MAKKFSPVRTAIGLVALAASAVGFYYALNTIPATPKQDFARIDFVSGGKKIEKLTARKGDNIYVSVTASVNHKPESRTLFVNGKPSDYGVCCDQSFKSGRYFIQSYLGGSLIPTSRQEFVVEQKNDIYWVIKDNVREIKSNTLELYLTKP